MSEEEYNNRIGKINAEISTDRVDADRGHYLLLQKLYLKDRYIEGLQQKAEQLENIRKEAIDYMKEFIFEPLLINEDRKLIMFNENLKNFENILNKGDNK